jgi:hypothetical protein
MRDGLQLCLFENTDAAIALDQHLWARSFGRADSTLHGLAADATLRTGLVQTLIDLYSQVGDVVLDPFCGAGGIPLEVALSDRVAWACDSNPYAYAIARGKLTAPRSERLALQQVAELIETSMSPEIPPSAAPVMAPAWVQDFFHPETLVEVLAAFARVRSTQDAFLMACLLSILQHVKAGALSYPTDPEVPMLRSVSYGAGRFPELYGYRDLRSRLIAKVRQVYRRHGLPADWGMRLPQVWQASGTELPIKAKSVNTIMTRPPRLGVESLQRHRLRLWFLGYDDPQAIQATLLGQRRLYEAQMTQCLQEMARVLKRRGACVLVVREAVGGGSGRVESGRVESGRVGSIGVESGRVESGRVESGRVESGRVGTAEWWVNLATTVTPDVWQVETVYRDAVPKRGRRSSGAASGEAAAVAWDAIVVLRKMR